jgi:hypothetical protein
MGSRQLRLVHSVRSRARYIEVEHPVRFEHVEPDHAGPGIGYALFIAACFTVAVVSLAMVLR